MAILILLVLSLSWAKDIALVESNLLIGSTRRNGTAVDGGESNPSGRPPPRRSSDRLYALVALSFLGDAAEQSSSVLLLEEKRGHHELTRRLALSLWDAGFQISFLNLDEKEDFSDFLLFIREALQSSHKILVFSFLQFDNFVKLLGQVKKNYLENQKIKWVALADTADVYEREEQLSIAREFQVCIVKPKSKTSISYHIPFLYPVQNIRPESELVLGERRLRNSGEEFQGSASINLQGVTLKVSVVDNWPFFGLVQDHQRYFPSSGIDASVLATLGHVMNFTYEILSPPDGQWGGPQPGGEITGMIGMVARGDADLAIDEITITAVREPVVDFTRPYYLESSTILSKAPRPASRTLAVFTPFATEIWLLLAICIFAYGFIVWVLRRHLLSKLEKGKRGMNFAGVVITTLQSMTYQGTTMYVKPWSLRFILISWYIFGLLIYALYAGTLTAVFAAPSFEKPIESLEDILRSENTVPVVTEGGSIHELFEASHGRLRLGVRVVVGVGIVMVGVWWRCFGVMV